MDSDAVIVAAGLGLRDARGTHHQVDMTVRPGEVVELVGPPGETRALLLRTLAARAEPAQGTLRVCGRPLPDESATVRRQVALAALPQHVLADPTAHIYDCIADQLVLSDLPRDSDLFDAAADLVGFRAGQRSVVTELPALQRRLLALALALMAPVQLVVVDDADEGLDRTGREWLWASFGAVTRTGTAVVAGVAAATSLSDRAVTIRSSSDHRRS